MLKAAVEGRVVPTEAELARKEGRDYEPASTLVERILKDRRRRWEDAELARLRAKGEAPNDDSWKKKYREPVAPDVAKLSMLPEGWCWVTSDQLFGYVTSGSRGWARYYSGGGPLFLRIENLDHDSISLDLSSTRRVSPPKGAEGVRTRVNAGDLLISITADVGMVGVVPKALGEAYINQHISLARPVPGMDLDYLAWFLASQHGGQPQFGALQRGATKQGLGLDDIRAVNVPLPPLAEQERISDEIDRRFSITDAASRSARRSESQLHRLRQSILRWAFEGKLVDQDPTDEPASALLERIMAERQRTQAVGGGNAGRNRKRKTA